MTYTPTDEQIEALANDYAEVMGLLDDRDQGNPNDAYRQLMEPLTNLPAFQAIIRAAQADAWGKGYDVGVEWESDMNSRTIPLADRRDNPYLEVS